MYRKPEIYDNIKRTIINIYIDYDLKGFPIDEKDVCRKLGIALVPYSEYNLKDRELLKKKSEYGFFIPETLVNPPTIFYNDSVESIGSIRFTIFHEIKHYVYEDCDDSQDDLADFFARYFMCPIPYLLLKGITHKNDIMSYCRTSMVVAENVCKNIINRQSKYGNKIFEYEKPLIKQLDPILFEVNMK